METRGNTYQNDQIAIVQQFNQFTEQKEVHGLEYYSIQ